MTQARKTTPKKTVTENVQSTKNELPVLSIIPVENIEDYRFGIPADNIPEKYYPVIKGYVKNDTIHFPALKEFTQEFVNVAKENDFKVFMRGSNENAVVKDEANGLIDISFGRFELRMYKEVNKELNSDIGILYDLTTAKPIIKAYTGTRVKTCLNQNIFGADEVIKNEFSNLKSTLQWAIEKLESENAKIEKHLQMIETMRELEFNNPQTLHELMGNLIKKSFGSTHGHQLAVSGYKSLADRKSVYYADIDNGKNNNLWNVFNACTEEISQGDKFFDNCDKTLSLYNTLMEVKGEIS